MSLRKIIPDKIHPRVWNGGMGDIDDIILYALNIHSPMMRSEFISDGYNRRMNKNTFHLHAKDLKKRGYITSLREGKLSYYKITSSGESELLQRLLKYKLDFDTLLKIEEKKNKNLIKRLSLFFESNEIYDIEVQIEYIKLASIITCEKLKEIYSEDQFNKLLLYIILNHPKFYLKYNISIEDFKVKYNRLSKGTLSSHEIGLFIEKVVDKRIYSINFHKLSLETLKNEFYFTENSEYGEFFKTVVDNRLRDLLLMRDLKNIELTNKDIERTYATIAYLLVERYKLFHPYLKNSLYTLIDNYRRTIREQVLKKSIFEIIDYSSLLILPEKPKSPNLKLVRENSIIEKENQSFSSTEYKSGVEDFSSFSISFENIKFISKENLLRKAWDSYEQRDYDATLNYINKIPELEENSELIYWKAEILGIRQDKFIEAFNVIELGIKINPMPSGYNFYRLKAEVLCLTENYEEALVSIDNAIEIDSQTKIILKKAEILIDLKKYHDLIVLAKDFNTISEEISKLIFNVVRTKYRFNRKINEEDALNLIDVAIKLEYNEPWKHQFKAMILSDVKNYSEALKEIDITLKLDKKTGKEGYRGISYNLNITQAYALKIIILKNLGRSEDIWDTYNKCKSTIDKERPVEIRVGEILDGILSNKEILNEFDDLILKYGNKNMDFIYLKAKFLHLINKNEEALDTIKLVLKVDNPNYYDLQKNILIELQRYQEALQSIQNAEDIISYPAYYNERVDILLLMNNFEGVVKYIQNFKYPEMDFGVYSQVAIKLINHEKIEEAKKVVESGLKYGPDDSDGFFVDIKDHFHNDIFNLLEKDDLKLALKIIDIYQNFDNRDPQIYRYKSTALLKLNNHKEALVSIDKAIELNPFKAEFHQFRALIFYELREYHEAINTINKAINLDPKKSIFFSIKADAYFKEHKYNDALEQIELAIKLDSSIPEYHRIKAQILLFMNKHDLALKTINKAIIKFPENASLYETKSIVVYGNESEALKAIEKAENLGREVSRYNKAQLLNKLGRHEEALETIEIEINEDPDAYGNYDIKAMILGNMERFEEALKFREKALNISGLSDKDSGCIKEQILCEYAVYLAEKGDKEKAIEVAEEAVELSGPEWASDSYEAYGDIFMVYKEYGEALDKYEKAKKSHIPMISVNLKIGICYFELGDHDEALKFLEAAKYRGEHNVLTEEVDENGNRVEKPVPQTEVIEEADRYISKIKKRLNEK